MKRLHVHVTVRDLEKAVSFYSHLFAARPCCAGSTYANWRVDEPPLNFAASIGRGRNSLTHLGLEVDSSTDLLPVDRVLRGRFRSSAALPWEVSVRKPIVRKERTP
jgi:catechol 2,3-dioxygenase-like lactoylglutathione lyase family enzyme